MASFCVNCGKKLEDGTVFCPQCGTRVISAKAGFQAPQNPPQRKKKSTGWTVLLIVFAVLLVAELAVAAFVAPGFLVRQKIEPEPVSPGKSAVNASPSNAGQMLEYARELEENGQYEAAAQIYSMLPDEILKDAEQAGKALVDGTPGKRRMDALEQARDFLNDLDEWKED